MDIEEAEARIEALERNLQSALRLIEDIQRSRNRILDDFEKHLKTFGDLTQVSTTLAIMSLQMSQHVGAKDPSTTRKMQELVAGLELTDAQHTIIQSLVTGLAGLPPAPPSRDPREPG